MEQLDTNTLKENTDSDDEFTQLLESPVITPRPEDIVNPGNPWGRKATATTTVGVFYNNQGQIMGTPTAVLHLLMSQKISSDSPIGEPGTPGANPGDPYLSFYTQNTHTKVNLNGVLFGHNERKCVLYADLPRAKGDLGLEETKKVLTELFQGKSETTLVQHYDSETATTPIIQRNRNQNAIMGGSATKDVSIALFCKENILKVLKKLNIPQKDQEAYLEKFAERLAEWLHQIDHKKTGKAGQIKDNLTYGTKEANTFMMVPEQYTNLLNEKGIKFKITTEAELLENNNNIPYVIKMTIQDERSEMPLIVLIDPFQETVIVKEAPMYFQGGVAVLYKYDFDSKTKPKDPEPIQNNNNAQPSLWKAKKRSATK